jgi:hypothetical protein
LAAFEVAIAGAGATFAGLKDVGSCRDIEQPASRQSGSGFKDFVEAHSRFGLHFTDRCRGRSA